MHPWPLRLAWLNVRRRPLRTLIAALSAAIVAAVLLATAGFAGGLARSLEGSAQPELALLVSAADRGLERSSVAAAVPELVASVPGVLHVGGRPAVSAEIHLATSIRLPGGTGELPASLRGVTPAAWLVHRDLRLLSGREPGADEALVGRLVAPRLGVDPRELQPGRTLEVEGLRLTISGTFAAPGSTLEAEIWVPLATLRTATRRDDCSAVFVRLESPEDFPALDLFARRRLDLELAAVTSERHSAELASWTMPIVFAVWGMAGLLCLAAVLSATNALNAAVQDRLGELALLRALGCGGWPVALSLVLESLLQSAAGAAACVVTVQPVLEGRVLPLAMTAIPLSLPPGVAFGAGAVAVLLGGLAAVPAIVRVLRLPVAAALREP